MKKEDKRKSGINNLGKTPQTSILKKGDQILELKKEEE